jgi:hypothetical protein
MQHLESTATGLPAWKRGQPGQVGNEAAPTVATSAGVGLVTFTSFAPVLPRARQMLEASVSVHPLEAHMRKWIFFAIAGYLWKKYGARSGSPAAGTGTALRR